MIGFASDEKDAKDMARRKDGKVVKENEAGTKVKDKEEKKVGRSYKAWQEKTKNKIGRVGEEEKGGLSNATMKYRKVGGRRVLMTEASGRGADDELKTKEQMIKAKEEQESKKSKNSKGHKGGKGAAHDRFFRCLASGEVSQSAQLRVA